VNRTQQNTLRITAIALTMFGLLLAAGAQPAHAQTFTPLYSFGTDDSPDTAPGGALVLGRDGNIYGTTNWNQSNIYNMTPGGAETRLWASAEGSGDQCEWQVGSYYPPFNGMTMGSDGLLYGTCWMWGYNQTSLGAIYKYDPSQGQNGITVVYSFPLDDCDAYLPSALTLGTDGNLYGVGYGCGGSLGSVFRFNPTTNTVATLHTFQGIESNDGANPSGPLTLGSNGDFYGTTYAGGVNGGSSAGTVYSITTKGKIKILYSFNAVTDPTTGTNPNSGVVQGADGNFYGVTYSGGIYGEGTIFKITPGGKLTFLHSFNESTDNAGYPVWQLTLGSDGNFYGSAQDCNAGGCSNESLFEISTKAKKGAYAYRNLYNFPNPEACSGTTPGCVPSSPLLQHPSGTFYGVTALGGEGFYGEGVFYSLSTGLAPFISLQFPLGTEGTSLGIFGQGFTTATAVAFNGKAANFIVVSDTYLTATIPSGATKGYVTVTESSATLKSVIKFTPKK